MAFPLDAATEAAIAAGRVKSADLVDFYLKTGAGAALTLRCWTWPGSASYPGTVDLDGSTANVTYEDMSRRIGLQKTLRLSASLSSEPLVIILDGSRSSDDSDWVGRFVDANWHQARVRVRSVLLNWDSGAFHSQPHWEWRGLLDHRNLTSRAGDPQTWEVKCQGGLFRVRGRRLRLRTHEDQQRRSAGDDFYKGTAIMTSIPLNWARLATQVGGQTMSGIGPAGVYGPSRFNPNAD
jgi:hypothetical protein